MKRRNLISEVFRSDYNKRVKFEFLSTMQENTQPNPNPNPPKPPPRPNQP